MRGAALRLALVLELLWWCGEDGVTPPPLTISARAFAAAALLVGDYFMVMAEKKGPLTEAKYLQALAKNHRLSRGLGIDAVMLKYQLDALVAPTSGPAWLIDLVNGDGFGGNASSPSTPAAVAGYPHITVPAGYFRGLPVGISFFGRAWSEPTLIKLAYAYEQATKHRRPPTFAPTADLQH